MPPTHIIFLNGPSSSGKTTLAKTLQRTLARPYLHFSSDQLVGSRVLPDRWGEGSEFSWDALQGPFFDGFHRCIAALAHAGNNLVVDHCLDHPTWLHDCVALLAPFDVFFVGLRCPLAELERRERERGDRQIGLAARQVEQLETVHAAACYDLEVDSAAHSPNDNARRIIAAAANPPVPSAFRRMAAR